MVGDQTASVIALLVVVIAGIIAGIAKRASREEVLPPGKVREFQQRVSTSHENLRKRAKK
jgi:hypothetical protein